MFQGLPDRPALAKLGVDGVSSFCFIHPVTSLTNRSRGIPEDLSLEARDCFTLWKAMCDCQTATYPVEKELDPATAIPDIPTKLDIIQWEGNLKSKLRDWMEARDSPFERLIQLLGPTTNTKANPGLLGPEKQLHRDSHRLPATREAGLARTNISGGVGYLLQLRPIEVRRHLHISFDPA